jgi:hypothetical protein
MPEDGQNITETCSIIIEYNKIVLMRFYIAQLFKYSETLEKRNAFICRVTELVQVNAEVIWKKKCVGYIGRFAGV